MVSPDVQQQALTTLPFLRTADEGFRQRFFEQVTPVTLPAGRFICMEGNHCAHLPLVLAGTARVYKIGETGREITLYRIEPGASCILTTSCILSDRAFPAFAVAETEVEALVVPAPLLTAWLRDHAAWRTYVFDLLSRRLAHVIELVEDVAFRHVDARLAAYLLDAMDPHAHTIERTHEAVAADLGTSREVVSRLLKDFEQAGLVALARGRIRVEAAAPLKQRAASA